MKIMTYNVQTGTPTPTRAANMLNNILDYDADIVGAQEINTSWLYVMKGTGFFKTYEMVGKPRNRITDLANSNEYSCIFYKKDLFNVLYSDTLWLSETPHEISKMEGTAYTRVMTYAVFERKSDKKKFMHVNTHVDYNQSVNEAQVKVILAEVKKLGFDLPTYYTGDFNMFSYHEGYKRMVEENDDARLVAKEMIEPENLPYIIDFCFVSKNGFEVNKYEMAAKEGSDHYPVYLDIEVK